MRQSAPDIRLTFNSQHFYVGEPGEKNSGRSIVDASGYIPAKERIESIMRAGERLDQYRREMYHYGEGQEDDGVYEDPLMEPGLDLSDVHRIRRDALRRLADQAARKQNDESEAKRSEARSESGQQSSEASASEPPAGGADQSGS